MDGPESYTDPVEVTVNLEKKGELYCGVIGGSRKTLIDCSERRDLVPLLKELKHPNVPKVEGIFSISGREYISLEEVTPLEVFFTQKKDAYKEDCKGICLTSNLEWWNRCEPQVRQVFGDAVNGMLYLYQKGFSCDGKTGKCLFVDKDGKGMVLPLQQTRQPRTGDYSAFCEVFKSVITVSSPAMDISTDCRYPYDVQSLLDSTQWGDLSDFWLFSHPMFWDTTKRISFIIGLDNLCRREVIFAELLAMAMDKFDERKPKWGGKRKPWVERIPVNSRLNDIVMYANSKSNSLQATSSAQYAKPVEIIKFSRNSLMHVKGLTLGQIEKELSLVTPHYLCWVYDSICKIKQLTVLPCTSLLRDVLLLKLTSDSSVAIFF